jgi:hypothetical protein
MRQWQFFQTIYDDNNYLIELQKEWDKFLVDYCPQEIYLLYPLGIELKAFQNARKANW